MDKSINKFILLVSILALGLAVAALIVSLKPAEQPAAQSEVKAEEQAETQSETKDVQYVLYLGTNDKDTGVMGFESREAAKAKAAEILIANFGGYTIQEADGGWIDDSGVEHNIYVMTQEQADEVLSIIETCTKVASYDTSIYEIVNEQAQAFFADQKSIDDVARLIQSKANIYVNEQR